jgi:hypothetical protein
VLSQPIGESRVAGDVGEIEAAGVSLSHSGEIGSVVSPDAADLVA